MKSRLPAQYRVANPRDSNGYHCGLRLVLSTNPSIAFQATIYGTAH